MIKETSLQVLTLDHDWAKCLLQGFSEWFYRHSPSVPGLHKKFLSNIDFFQRLDASYQLLQDITAEALLRDFGSKMLRKNLLAVRFLGMTNDFQIPSDLRCESTDRELVAQTLISNKTYPWGTVLVRYAEWLESQSISSRTMRMYLRTAASLCQAESISLSNPLSTDALARFLVDRPGLRANSNKFATFCKKALGWQVSVPKGVSSSDPPLSIKATQRLTKKLEAAISTGVDSKSFEELTELLADLFALSMTEMRENAWSINESGGIMSLRSDIDELIVPTPLHSFVRKWMALKAAQAAMLNHTS